MKELRWDGHDTGVRFLNTPLYRSRVKSPAGVRGGAQS